MNHHSTPRQAAELRDVTRGHDSEVETKVQRKTTSYFTLQIQFPDTAVHTHSPSHHPVIPLSFSGNISDFPPRHLATHHLQQISSS